MVALFNPAATLSTVKIADGSGAAIGWLLEVIVVGRGASGNRSNAALSN